MSWELKNKKDVQTRIAMKCADCKNPIFPGSFARVFTFVKKEDEQNQYGRKHICEECEKYYRGNNVPKM